MHGKRRKHWQCFHTNLKLRDNFLKVFNVFPLSDFKITSLYFWLWLPLCWVDVSRFMMLRTFFLKREKWGKKATRKMKIDVRERMQFLAYCSINYYTFCPFKYSSYLHYKYSGQIVIRYPNSLSLVGNQGHRQSQTGSSSP